MKTHLLALSPAEFCRATRACSEGADYAKTQPTMHAVWENCPKVGWLIWILNAIGAPQDDKALRLFAVWCARNTPLADGRKTGDLLTDPRSLSALEVAERYAHGKATAQELAAAGAAARDAAWAAGDAAWAAWDAAWAAGDAARAAGAAAWAAGAAAWAAGAAAWAAGDAAWAAGDAAWAAWAAARAAWAARFKRVIANPFPKGVQS
jgi:hypothetical protein